MTTGRINQVTIVHRAKRPTARVSGQKRCQVTGKGTEAQGPRRWPGLCQARGWFLLLSSPEFPRAPSAGETRSPKRPDTPPKSPKRRPCRKVLRVARSPAGRYPRWLCYRAGQRPCTHRAQPSALAASCSAFSCFARRLGSPARGPAADAQQRTSRRLWKEGSASFPTSPLLRFQKRNAAS